MLLFASTDIGHTKPSLLPPSPPSDEEPKQREGDKRPHGCETPDDPATERVAIAATRVARGSACSIDDILLNAFAKGTSIKRETGGAEYGLQ